MKNIILIGSSQNGKSALANFLLYGKQPENPNPDDVIFVVGDGLTSCTSEPQSGFVEWEHRTPDLSDDTRERVIELAESVKDSNGEKDQSEQVQQKINWKVQKDTIRILDTAGVSDSEGKESQNMIKLYQELANITDENQELSCAALVIKFPQLLDKDYLDNLRFYKKLFPQLFDGGNVIIVVTDCNAENKAWKKKQARTGHPVEEVLKKMEQIFQNTLEIGHHIPMFTIDSFADPEDEKEDFQNAQNVRSLIFGRAFDVRGIKMKSLMFPKPTAWKSFDKSIMDNIRKKREGIQVGFKITDKIYLDIMQKAMKQLVFVEEQRSTLKQIEQRLSLLDSNSSHIFFDKSFFQIFGPFWWSSESFEIKSHCTFDVKCSNGFITGNYSLNQTYFKGKIYSYWFTNLNATVTATAKKRDYFADAISMLKRRRDELDESILVQIAAYNSILAQHSDVTEQLSLLSTLLEATSKIIDSLDEEMISLSQLNQLRSLENTSFTDENSLLYHYKQHLSFNVVLFEIEQHSNQKVPKVDEVVILSNITKKGVKGIVYSINKQKAKKGDIILIVYQ
eukprot:TRINITY_DN5797_c0_g1_i1.p1 TRINITY_DN5797_c0_g1~~TRINITY_DN5797_c0_g1_i1.p1  ORF type:complete len:565 (-),score=87.61 TRINITY_DN5797_c0_g1_i1:386-2080(-)